jgi:hypothetical protein
METVSRESISGIEQYKEILEKESHHDHELIKDERGALRWKEDPKVIEIVDTIGLNNIWCLFHHMGLTKNSEEVRKLYRDIGYSLYGYWEIFYWEMNNEDASEYRAEK